MTTDETACDLEVSNKALRLHAKRRHGASLFQGAGS